MFKIGEVDVKGLEQYGNMLGALGSVEAPKVQARALNRTGDMARTQVVKALAKQTGLPQKTIRKALHVKRSSWTSLDYVIYSRGGNISLKYFKPRETLRGVTALVRGERELFEGTFMKGGSFVKGRVDIGMGGHVFERIGGRTELERVRSGVFIPDEMIQGESVAAFDRVVKEVLPRRVDHELNRALGI